MRPIHLAPLALLAATACMSPFRRPDPDPRPAKAPTGTGIFVGTVGEGCRGTLVGNQIRRACGGRERERGGTHEPKDSTSSSGQR